MSSNSGIVPRIRLGFTWYLLAKITLALLVIAVSAAITVSNTNYQAEMGSAYQVNNNITVEDKGFTTATTNTGPTGTCPTGNVTFTSTHQTANNGITAGDLVYDVQVNTTANSPTMMCLTVTLTLSIGGTQTTKSVTIATGSTITAAQAIDCMLDIGTSAVPASPFSFKVTVG